MYPSADAIALLYSAIPLVAATSANVATLRKALRFIHPFLLSMLHRRDIPALVPR
jgi:hypothetical protein